MDTPLSPTRGSYPAFTDHLDLMFGTGERCFKDEPHVQVWRRTENGVRYFSKNDLRFQDEKNQDIDLSFWTDREEQMLTALNAGRLGLKSTCNCSKAGHRALIGRSDTWKHGTLDRPATTGNKCRWHAPASGCRTCSWTVRTGLGWGRGCWSRWTTCMAWGSCTSI